MEDLQRKFHLRKIDFPEVNTPTNGRDDVFKDISQEISLK